MRFCIGRREESSRGIKNPFTFTDACPVGLFLPPSDDDDDDGGGGRNARGGGGGGGGLADAQRRGEKTKPAPQRKRTHARHLIYTRGTTPKKPCFRPRKRGKKREKERYKTSLFVTRTWYNSAHIIMSTECTEAAFKLTPLAGNGAIGSREYYTLEGSDTACTKQASCVSLLVFFSRR